MARSTMADLITRVRALASVGTADYTLSGSTYWTDDQIQAVLDRYRLDFADDQLRSMREYDAGGTARYYTHTTIYSNLEATSGGSTVLYIRDSTGARAGTTAWTADYNAGRFTFTADTAGTVYYLTGRSYDVYAAAAELWETKAAHVAERFDFTADGASFKASQLISQYEKMAARCASQSSMGGITVSTFYRDDVNTVGTWPSSYTADAD